MHKSVHVIFKHFIDNVKMAKVFKSKTTKIANWPPAMGHQNAKEKKKSERLDKTEYSKKKKKKKIDSTTPQEKI